MPEHTRRDLIRIAVLWVLLSALGEAAAAAVIAHYPLVASREAIITSDAVFFLLRVAIPALLLVALIIVYSMIRFTVPGDDSTASEHQYRSGRAFPWTWVTISVVLNVLFIIHPGITGLSSLWSTAAAATDPLEVDVTASQWQWRFTYPAQELANQTDLVVPVDTPVRFVLRSDDVIHSFWVPAWGIKRALIPGEVRTLIVTPDQIIDTSADPTARVQCSQICGVGHAEMQSEVRVISRTDFDQWVQSARAAAADNTDMPGMDMPGMDMPGMKMPGMQTPSTEMPGMQMPMQHDMPGMQMPAPVEEAAPMGHDMSGMRAPAEAPPTGQMPMKHEMPMGGQMPMDDAMPDGSQN